MATSASKKVRRKSKPPAITRLLLVRHAEVELRYQRIFGGRIDMNLSARGRSQARHLARFLRTKTFDAIYTSPMKRVQQTLAPLLNDSVPAPVVLHDFREVDFGDWTGFNWEQVGKKFKIHPYDWLGKIESGQVSNGETGVQLRARIEPRLNEIIRRHRGENVAIFSHGGAIRMMLAILLDLPLPKTNSFGIDYASVTQVALRPDLNEMELLNFTPWA